MNKFVKEEGRRLPVFLLVDVSGSMMGPKIDTVNVALKEMISQFRNVENPRGVIELSIITFGGSGIKVIKELSAPEENEVYTLSAGGKTPMGEAFLKVHDLIEDKNVVTSRDYTPTIVLISDGNPTDYDVRDKTGEEILRWDRMQLIHGGDRTSKALKLAMGIGDDMNRHLLGAFINDPNVPVIRARDVNTISKFFKWVTMTVKTRSVNANPNKYKLPETEHYFDEDEVDFR